MLPKCFLSELSFDIDAPTEDAADELLYEIIEPLELAEQSWVVGEAEPTEIEDVQEDIDGLPNPFSIWRTKLFVIVVAESEAQATDRFESLKESAPESFARYFKSMTEPEETEHPDQPTVMTIHCFNEARNEIHMAVHRYNANAYMMNDVGIAHKPEDLVHGQSIQDFLPPVFAHRYNPELVNRWATVLDQVYEKICEDGPHAVMDTIAEELALHALVHEGFEAASMALIKVNHRILSEDERLSQVDAVAIAEEQISDIHAEVTTQYNALSLFDEIFEGIPAEDIAETLGINDLEPEHWFE